ncbi:MAG: hypothetical protein COT33_03465 [Candidatus Nealsonbacteria bacterium CG08_land_8_20_14_0_20_38_20]|uniref:General secretion pathway GspH domain-containing protein n=1 Tax=Candidatus Nealsonbacteria bacterium CG08_land_8_20_14_0_20_38_20 TaxID=1974705 RepID=A0A2H0YL49_9BACT|nr:MAG: hypothetical protein COT33_03465 [Candidatus Nealsonbacteria bacterium CG08_land_8_20_14_0_20_38_20]
MSSKFKIQNSKLKTGFTLVELIVVLGIMIILIALTVPAYQIFKREADLTNSTEEIINNLRLAQSKTLASEGAGKWGLYFSTSTNQYVLFKGNNYATRATSSDEVHKLKETIEFFDVSLAGGNEVVFDRVTGTSGQPGIVSLRLKSDPTKIKTIYVENSGQVGQNAPSSPSDSARKKDSRHVHFDYSRQIATSSEILTLIFGSDDFFTSTTSQDVVISENLKDGQIYWEGEVNAFGSIQKLKIHTHRLNESSSPKTVFSIHRDRRYNNKALSIEIKDTPDPDIGTLIGYTATGTDALIGTSIYVSNTQRQ